MQQLVPLFPLRALLLALLFLCNIQLLLLQKKLVQLGKSHVGGGSRGGGSGGSCGCVGDGGVLLLLSLHVGFIARVNLNRRDGGGMC